VKKRPELNTIKANDWRSVQRFSEEVTEILQRENPEWDLVIRDDSKPAPGKYIVDTRVKALRIIVPTGQALFAQIVLWDGWENANTNNVTITGSGVSETGSTNGEIITLVHVGNDEWLVKRG